MYRVLGVIGFFACAMCVTACSSTVDSSRRQARSPYSSVYGYGVSQLARSDEVLLEPSLRGGTAGWCVSVVATEIGACPPIGTPPILSEGCGPHEYSSHLMEDFALTTSQVANVSIEGGAPIATRAESVLPDGLRAVFVEIHSQKALDRRRRCPQFSPLGANGEAIPRSDQSEVVLAAALPGRVVWQSPLRQPHGACGISTTHLPGVAERRGSAATRIIAVPGLIGRAFLSCINVSYHAYLPEDGETDLSATVLLDAAHPGSTPAPLPGMKPLPNHLGIVKAPSSDGDMVARRISGAWLLVKENGEEGSSGLRLSLTLLEHLRTTINL